MGSLATDRLPKVQKALMLEKIGQPMTLTKRRVPEPKENEVLVKVKIAGINPHDAKSFSIGLFVQDSLPTPLAADIVGEVVQLGPGVSKFKLGDVVFGFGDPQVPDELGTQEYCILNTTTQAARVPRNVSLDEAATFPLNVMTSFYALFHHQGLDMPPPFPDQKKTFDYAAESLVIIGGASATGKFGIQLGKVAGIGKIIAIASRSNEQQLKSLGATHVIDRHLSEDQIYDQVRAITGDELLYVYDCVSFGKGGHTLGVRLLSNSRRGTLAVLILRGSVDETSIGEKKEGYEKKWVLCTPKRYPEVSVPLWEHLPGWIEEGTLKPTTFEVLEGFDAGKINGALNKYNEGKRVVKPHVHL